jgi:hypothetical protein
MADITTLAREQAQKQIAEGQTLIDTIQGKMKKIVDEFAAGEISREQFQKIYEHYQGQIVLAAQMMMDADSLSTAELNPGETMAIRKGLTAKAKAMTVYYHATGLLLETIGDFDVPVALISPTLNNIGSQVSAGNKVETRVEKFNNEWLLYMPGKYSTAVMLLSHEPAARQISIMENMQRDFEGANENILKSGHAEGNALVYPFKAVVRRSVAK